MFSELATPGSIVGVFSELATPGRIRCELGEHADTHPADHRMPFRLLLALLTLVAAPLALLGWVSSTSMRQQSELARKQLQSVLRTRLVEIDRNLSGVLDQHVRRVSDRLDRQVTMTKQLRSLELTDPIVRKGILVDESGNLFYPPEPAPESTEELAFYASLLALIDGRPSGANIESDDPIQLSNAPLAIGKAASKSVSQKPQSASKGRSVSRLQSEMQQQSNTQQQALAGPNRLTLGIVGSPRWQVWYLDEGSQLVLWFPLTGGANAGVMFERARWISDLTAALPDTAAPNEDFDSSSFASTVARKTNPNTPGFTALVDESNEVIYRWGDEGECTGMPLATIPLSAPLSSWHLQYHADESLLPKANPTPLYASLAGLAAALIGLGGYVLTSVQRQMKTARSRVSFAGQVSHELRTPLTNIQLYAELAESDLAQLPENETRTKLAKRLGVIDAESKRLGRLVSGVLEMIRDERKQRGPKIVKANPDEWIDRTVNQFDPSFQKTGIKVVRNSGASQVVGFDPDILEMVLINLLSNVEKYAADGKHVEVSSQLTGKELIVTVSDHGRGIPRRHHRRVFRPFSRLDDSISAPSGTGIGLTIARRAALRHGGDLRLIPCPDGSCFELRIPVE